ncbi:MAG: hypothetical protein SOX13_02810, partial [Sodaliphilus sp.]|nr:hypothetical protein [Sodaliphilus sp.]
HAKFLTPNIQTTPPRRQPSLPPTQNKSMQTIAPPPLPLHPPHHLTQIQPIQQKNLKKQSLFKKIITTFEGN